jgi:hypothetical protein
MKISWTDIVKSEEVLQRVKEDRCVLLVHAINRSEADCIGHILRKNCFLKRVVEGKIEGKRGVMGRRTRRFKQLLDGLNKREYTGN